jgi:predicted CopG family antitoxin|tara:strand:+ start:14 stop:334 length:321 start_codon:yes stop_codon:yes gene_type:complete
MPKAYERFIRTQLKNSFSNVLQRAVDRNQLSEDAWMEAVKWADTASPEEISKKAGRWAKRLDEIDGAPPEIDSSREQFIEGWRKAAEEETLVMDELLGRIYDSINS